MYRPKQTPIRLPRLGTLPGIDDVMSAMENARSRMGVPVELSWVMGDGVTIYRLIATCAPQSGDLTWDLLVGEGRNEVQAWTYTTGDVALVLNLVLSESTENITEGAMDQSLLLGENSDRNTGLSSSYSTSLMGLQSLSSTSSKLPVFQASRALRPASMEGTLEEMQIPNLLQSIAMGKNTGKLTVTNEETGAELFFVEGELTHAQVLNLKGDLAIMELVTWDTGRFFFYRDERSEQRTVQRRVDAILMESVTLLDQSKYLLDSGLKMDSYIDKKDPLLTEALFEEAVKKGAPCDVGEQKQFYLRLDGNSTLFDILRERPMVKKDWVPVLFNMMRCDLITLSDKPRVRDKASLLQSTALDRNAIDTVSRSMRRPDTGIISYPVFQYFLEQEYHRFQFNNAPFSVIVFEVWVWGQDKLEALPIPAVAEVARRIGAVKRNIDILAHFEALHYAMLLPNTETASAAILGHRCLEVLTATSLTSELATRRLAVAFGIAGIPEDCRDVGLLLSAAKVAKNLAQQSDFPIIMFKDLQAPSA
jgi:hypothetical protein